MAYSERIRKHKSVFQVKPFSHNPPGINDFHIIKPISKGAFGQVFLARRKNTKEVFAIKAMKKSDVLNKNMMEQVVVERDALAVSSKSSFVVQLFYSFQDKNNIFLVMEFMIGGDLKSLLHNLGYFDEHMARFYVAEVTLALEYLHIHSIYHSDIKPDNMLLSGTGHVKLTDFGLCTLPSESKPTAFDLVKHNTPCGQLTRKHSKVGNVYWRTPGQLQSLVTKFNFSSPKEKAPSRLGRSYNVGGSFVKSRNMDFEFSTPGKRSFNSTPCGLPPRPSVLKSSLMNDQTQVKKLSFLGAEHEETLRLKRNFNSTLLTSEPSDLSDTTKRFRSSFPNDGHFAKENNFHSLKKKRSTVTFNTVGNDEYNLSFPVDDTSDHEASVENMSVDTTVFMNNTTVLSNGNISGVSTILPDNNNISGVTMLTDTSMMSVGGNTSMESNITEKKNLSLLKELNWKQSSPNMPRDVTGDQQRFNTPVRNLSFDNDTEAEYTSEVSDCPEYTSEVSDCPEYTSEVSDCLESTVHVATESEVSDSSCEGGADNNKSFNAFEMQNLRSATPFRTPKSCTRGKRTIEKKKKFRGTPDYLAPEVLLEQDHGGAADFWSLGVCFYEFVTGVPPFNDDTPELVFEHILQHDILWPEGDESLAEDTVESIKWLLSPNPVDRPCALDIKQMATFSNIDWDTLVREEAPFVPQPDDGYDTTYFDAKNDARQFKLSEFKI